MRFLDTNVLIELARADAATVEFVQGLDWASEEAATTSINVAEFLRGIRNSGDRAVAKGLLEGLHQVPFGPRAARQYGEMMQALDRGGRRIPTADGLVAAIVLSEGGELVTRDVADFERIPNLRLVPVPKR